MQLFIELFFSGVRGFEPLACAAQLSPNTTPGPADPITFDPLKRDVLQAKLY